MEYYICHKGRRLTKALTRDQAFQEIFILSGAFKHLSIQIVDKDSGEVKRVIKLDKKRRS